MNKVNVGDMFIIKIAGEYDPCNYKQKTQVNENSSSLYLIEGFNSLVFDSHGIDKLQKITKANIEEWIENSSWLKEHDKKIIYKTGLREYLKGYEDGEKNKITFNESNIMSIIEEWEKRRSDYINAEEYNLALMSSGAIVGLTMLLTDLKDRQFKEDNKKDKENKENNNKIEIK